MQSLQGHAKASGMPGRRLASNNTCKLTASTAHYVQGIRTRPYRLYAAETLGSSVEGLRVRRSLTQSLELDGSAPEGHPDNALITSSISASSTDASSSSIAARLHLSSSNGNGTTRVTSVRRLRSSRTRAAAAGSSSDGAGASSAAAVAAAAAAEEEQYDAATLVKGVFPSTPDSHASSSNNGSSNNGTGSAFVAAAEEPQQQQQPPQQQQQYDAESDKELQAEFHESRCCQDVLDIIADELPRFSPFHTITAINRLAKLGRSLNWEQRREVLADQSFLLLLELLMRQAGDLNPFQLSTCMYSFAVLQVPVTPTLLRVLEHHIARQIKEFNDRDVSSTLYAYAQIRLGLARKQESMQVLTLLCQQAQSLVDRNSISGQSTSMALWSVATLHAAAAAAAGSSSSKQFAAASHALVTAAAKHLRESGCSFDQLGSQGVANSIWAAAKLGYHDVALLQKGCEWVAQHLEQCKSQEVLNVLWAAGAGRFRPKQLGRITKHIASKAQALKPADVASLFHVLGIFGYDFSTQPDLLAVLLPRAQTLLPSMKPYEAASLYWGLGMTRSVDCQLFQQLTVVLSKLQLQQQQAQLQLQQLGLPADGSSPQQPPQQQQLDTKQVQQLQERARQLPESLQRQSFQAFIAAKLEDVDVQLHPDALAAFRAAWMAGSSSGSSSSSSGGGGGKKQQQQKPLLDDLSWLLQQLKIKAKVNTRSQDGLIPVDIELTASGQRLVALQIIDEYSTDHEGNKLAPVQWEEDVLARNGYAEVYYLRVSELKRQPKDARPRFIAEILRRLGVRPQERLLAAAEKGWASRHTGAAAAAGLGGDGAGLGMVGASGIRASEADVLMQGVDSSSSSSAGGGWAAGGGRGSRSRRIGGKRR